MIYSEEKKKNLQENIIEHQTDQLTSLHKYVNFTVFLC